MPNEAWTPLLFVRVRNRARMNAEAREAPSATEQLIAIGRWAEQQDRPLTERALIVHTRARYRPGRDRVLRAVIDEAREKGRMLIMDDVFRFAGGCDAPEALEVVQELLSLQPPIVSIRHGATLLGLKAETMKKEVMRCALEFRQRSERAKKAAAHPDNLQPAPLPKARKAASRVRGLVADRKARRLAQEIERVRASLPPEKRKSRSAIAAALNEAEIAPPSGAGRWQGTTVKRVLERAGRLPDE